MPHGAPRLQPGSAWLAQHYGWALERVFSEQGHSHVVILEDDMLFSPGARRGVRGAAAVRSSATGAGVHWEGWRLPPPVHAPNRLRPIAARVCRPRPKLSNCVSLCSRWPTPSPPTPPAHLIHHNPPQKTDFLEYFEATAPLLDADPSLWCISSWNDNGFAALHEWSPSRLVRVWEGRRWRAALLGARQGAKAGSYATWLAGRLAVLLLAEPGSGAKGEHALLPPSSLPHTTQSCASSLALATPRSSAPPTSPASAGS